MRKDEKDFFDAKLSLVDFIKSSLSTLMDDENHVTKEVEQEVNLIIKITFRSLHVSSCAIFTWCYLSRL